MQGKTRLPSLRAVEIFVAAGRALSFVAAAQAVNLTPSAVSRRIRDLERELGTPLFRRFNRRVELTQAGARFLDAAGQAIDLIEYETARLRPQRDGRTLRLSALQSLASTWLLPRLAVLQRRRPDVEVQIETSAELADLIRGPFDAAVRFGEGNWPGLSAERLFETLAFAVAAPAHWPCGATASPAALERATLLGVVHIPDLWGQYLAGLGMAEYRPRRVQMFDNVHVMHEAAANGLGLALTVRELVGEQLVAGRLAPAFSNRPVPLRQGYYLVCRKDRHREPALQALRAVRSSIALSLSDASGSSFALRLAHRHRAHSKRENIMRMVLPVTAIGLIILAGFVPVAPVRAADLDANKHLVHEYIETAINGRRPDLVTDYFAANYIEHNPRLPPGLAGKKHFIGSLMAGFSDYHGEIEEIIADGDKVVTRTRWTGTQDGPFLGRPATGNKLDFTTADFYRVEDGKIIEHWDVVDSLARAIGLGLISPPK